MKSFMCVFLQFPPGYQLCFHPNRTRFYTETALCVLEMGDQWTPQTNLMMSDPCLDPKDLSSISHISVSHHTHTHTLPSTHSYSVLSAFCTEDNIPQCVTYINQEASSLGLCGVCVEPRGGSNGLSAVPALNLLFELLQLQRKHLRTLQDLEHRQLKNCSDLEHLQHNNSRLKDQLEHTRRENSGLHEGERQLHLKIRTLQSCLKSEKEEVQKLQSIISSRATQYSHDAKRKERECTKLKERLNQLLVDKRDKKLAIEVVNCVSRSDGKRGMWKTSRMEARHEGEMYQALLNDYEVRQQALVQENSELKKLLQHIKKDMVSILNPNPHCSRTEDSLDQVNSEDEECSKENTEQVCVDAREQLANSIRLQWRKLKNHMHTLDTQVSHEEMISRREHEGAMQHLRKELQQCTEFIHTQQLLLQQLVSPFDEDAAALLNDGYTLEEKERLKDEWRIFNEQKKTFERERKNFTEAAIRLGHERTVFEEDRAMWLKTQFLNMTPFIERKRPASSHSQSSLSKCSPNPASSYSQSSLNAEPEAKLVSTPDPSVRGLSLTEFSSPKPSPFNLPSTAELYRTLQLRPNTRSSGSTQTSSSDAPAAHT
ncbi:synovial sarcoma, X breakpoint 2 interacting protein a isoform X1 [Silurus meridionalis]|uniref:synovial sarcoma, X breakpoint 2 interacting protein a isoform X1 n=2 Tax=Silurus meridionalis TaxID=175797 RepID=UPI001EEA1C1D|nr:synovial sarcoma, X breakpoint 2 interacting protein a isoform X1 [Silurus meridionalis]